MNAIANKAQRPVDVNPMRSLRDHAVVVTGGSSGVGAGAARRLRELGASVAVVGRSPERAAAVAAEIGAEPHLADFGRLDDVRRLAEELLARYPRIDVLANNAGALFASRTVTVDGHEMSFSTGLPRRRTAGGSSPPSARSTAVGPGSRRSRRYPPPL
jgi:NAD(P)-dependent dehydrogenase (short-subunit alcohol dehydrogenase family)